MTISSLKFDNGIWDKFLMAFLIICPVFWHGGFFAGTQTLRLGQEQFFQMGTTVLCALFLVQNVYLGAFLSLAAAIYSFYGFPPASGMILLNILFFSLLYAVFYKSVSIKNFEQWTQALKWLVFIHISLMFFQAIGYDPVYSHPLRFTQNIDLVGVMGIKAFSGIFLALLLPFIAKNSLLIGFMMLFPIALSQSSCAFVSAIPVLAFYAIPKIRGRFIPIIILASFLAGAFYISKDIPNKMFSDRANLWFVATKDAMKKPLTGWGLDAFRSISDHKKFIYAKDTRDNKSYQFGYNAELKSLIPPKGFRTDKPIDPWDHPHNELVSLFYEFGMVGVLLITFFIRDIVKRYLASPMIFKYTTPVFLFFVVLFINSMGHFPLHVARTAFIVPLMLAFFYKITDAERKLHVRG